MINKKKLVFGRCWYLFCTNVCSKNVKRKSVSHASQPGRIKRCFFRILFDYSIKSSDSQTIIQMN